MEVLWRRLAMMTGATAIPLFGVQILAEDVVIEAVDVRGRVEIWVSDESGMEHEGGRFPVLYMATDRGGWNPGGHASVGEVTFQTLDPEDPQSAWAFVVEREWLEGEGILAKFTRGDWSTVEVDSEGREIANRRFTIDMVEPGTNIIGVRLMGFADQHRGVENERASTVTGTLEVFDLGSEILGRSRTIRVWLPEGYEASGETRYPVMYMHDGQNLFDEATSFIGVEWGVDETLTELIASGEVPAMIVVGMDNSGAFRAADYNPEGTSHQGRENRGDLYLRSVLEEIMPEIERRYRVLRGSAHTGMGGSSFGGNATLYAAMRAPGVFGKILVESPASWIGDRVLVKMSREHAQWPLRIFIAMGSNEYGEPTRDAELIGIARELRDAVAAKAGEDSVRLVVEEGGAHNEGAWARRLPEAMRFLWGRDGASSGGGGGAR